jgi:hypothetical protein
MQLSIRSLILCISCSFLIFVTRAIDINSSSFATPTVTKTINRTTVRRASVPPIRTHDHGVAIPELGFVEDGGYKGNDASSTLDTSIVVDSRSFAGESLGMKPTVSQQQVHGLPAVLNSRSIQSLSTAGFTGNVETDYAKSGLLLRKTTNLYNMKLETKDLEGIISIYMPNNTALAFCKHVQEEPSGESEHAKRGEGAHHELSLNIGDGKTSIDVQHNIAVNFCRRVKHGEGIKGSKPTSSKNHQATSAPLSTIPKWNPSKTTEIPEIPEDNPESPKKSTGAKSSKTPASEEQNVTSEPPSTKPTEVPITSSEVGVSTEALESSPVPKKTSTLIKSTSAESDDETPTKAQASLNQLAPIEKPTLIEDASDDLVASTDVVKASSPRKPTCTPSQSESVSYDDEDIGNPSEVISTVPPTRHPQRACKRRACVPWRQEWSPSTSERL